MKQGGNNLTIQASAGTRKAAIAECCPRGRCNSLFDPTNEEKEQ
jgi:hypothetical protein